MHIAVTTPTGNVGRHVVDLLLRAGLHPTVLARDPDRLAPAVRDRVTAIPVDQGDREAVLAATRGVDALFWVNPPNTAEDPAAEHARVGAIVAEAVRTNGFARTVFQSSVGAEQRHGSVRSTAWPEPRRCSTPPAGRSCTCAAATSSPTSRCSST